MKRREVDDFQLEQITAVRDALETEPIMWRTITHLFTVSGCRRGELLGLKWENVDFDRNRIRIVRAALYPASRGC